ncbi:hypothetical protein HPB50_023496 [Hyalomma asiaticum]|uniref:Uncharacterized protein n=1 Tax=Hyalomma asiaticum TaxID=266040 RepID=A0ACB7SDS2_HYAAI|nr:hypothetical protein HPB50_023496 [Hyalomma asiaticum]
MDVVEVEGTEITPEDATLEAGWISSHRKKQRKHASNAPTSSTPQNSITGIAMSDISSQRPARKPRQPRLPDNHVKVVIRPRDGLNLSKMGEAQVRDAILREVDLNATLLKEDIYRTCVETNLIVVSTPHLSNAEIYSRITKLQVDTKTYDVRSYVTSPDNTAKGVIHHIPPYDSPEAISASLVNDQNPTILQARRMGTTNTALIVFDGDQVPFHVYYRGAEYKCYLHKKRTEVCVKCGAVGHRADVCPTPTAVICAICGTANPTTDHPCTVRCALCGQAHQTGDKTCPQRYQTPRLLIHRRQEKARLQLQEQQDPTSIVKQDSSPESQDAEPRNRRSRSLSPQVRRPRSRSRSKQQPKHQHGEPPRSTAPEASAGPSLQQRQPPLALAATKVSWAGIASQPTPIHNTKPATATTTHTITSVKEDVLSTITQELRSLRTLVQELRVENATLRQQLAQQPPAPSVLRSADLGTDPAHIPAKRKAPNTVEPVTPSSQPHSAPPPTPPVESVPQQQLHSTIQTVLAQQLPLLLEKTLAQTLERSLESILTAKLEQHLSSTLDEKLAARATIIQGNLETTLTKLLASYNSRVTELERCALRPRSHSHQKPYDRINQDGHE